MKLNVQDEEGQTSCKPCDIGYYGNIPGEGCKACAAGTYTDKTVRALEIIQKSCLTTSAVYIIS